MVFPLKMLFLFPFPNRSHFKVYDAVFVQFAWMLINRFSIKHWKSWIKYTLKTTMMHCHYQLYELKLWKISLKNTLIESYTHARERKTNEKPEKKITPNSPSDWISELKQSSVKSLTKSFCTVEIVFAMAHPGSVCILSKYIFMWISMRVTLYQI